MIAGIVNDALDAVVTLTVQGDNGLTADVAAVLDTGFSGALILPIALIESLHLESDGVREATTADGKIVVLDTYRGSVIWDSVEIDIEILATTNEPLLGMELLRGFRLRIDVVPGGNIRIEALTWCSVSLGDKTVCIVSATATFQHDGTRRRHQCPQLPIQDPEIQRSGNSQ